MMKCFLANRHLKPKQPTSNMLFKPTCHSFYLILEGRNPLGRYPKWACITYILIDGRNLCSAVVDVDVPLAVEIEVAVPAQLWHNWFGNKNPHQEVTANESIPQRSKGIVHKL